MSSWAKKTDAIFLQILVGFAILIGLLFLPQQEILAVDYFRLQDAPVTIMLCAILALSAIWLPRVKLPATAPSLVTILTFAIAMALALWAGTYLVLYNYPLTRDEHMVVFDAAIFATGELAAHSPAQWAGYAEALVPAFLLDVPNNVLLISSYMPGNAMMRTAFGMIADPAFMNPLLAGVGLIALHDIARRLFKDSPAAVWVVLGSYILSTQMLVTAMTTYAMTAHLALNLIWLALFLRGRWWHHMFAILIGAWAIGLHQIVFHPLFAGPFLLALLPQKRWTLFAVYSAAYAGALLFWISYPSIMAAEYGIIAQSGSAGGVSGFISERVVTLFTERGNGGALFMLFNLTRFVAWAPLFLLPLLVFAFPAVRSNMGCTLPLFGGCALTLVAMIVLLPYQGHGWGYRYWHGLIGNFALLGGYGYMRWAERDKRVADGGVVLLGACTVLLAIPFLLWSARDYTRPYVQLKNLIARQSSDFVIVDTHPPSSAVDQVRNSATLNKKPVLLSSRAMTRAQVNEICAQGSVTLITRHDFHRAGFVPNLPEQSPEFEELVSDIKGKGCIQPTT